MRRSGATRPSGLVSFGSLVAGLERRGPDLPAHGRWWRRRRGRSAAYSFPPGGEKRRAGLAAWRRCGSWQRRLRAADLLRHVRGVHVIGAPRRGTAFREHSTRCSRTTAEVRERPHMAPGPGAPCHRPPSSRTEAPASPTSATSLRPLLVTARRRSRDTHRPTVPPTSPSRSRHMFVRSVIKVDQGAAEPRGT